MSDRVSASVVVPTLLANKAIELIETLDGHPDNSNQVVTLKGTDFGLTELHYAEVSDGWLHSIDSEQLLTKKRIPFDFSWESCGGEPAGHYSGRIQSDGSYHQTEVVTDNVAPDPDEMLTLIDQGRLVELATLIKDHLKGTHPIPWETQIEPVKKLAAELLLDG